MDEIRGEDLVLLNDSFAIIVKAIEQGRTILDNLRKAIAYILADSFTSVILVGASLLFGWPLPILWTQSSPCSFINRGDEGFDLCHWVG